MGGFRAVCPTSVSSRLPLLSPPDPGLTCAIFRVIVVAKDVQCLPSPDGHLGWRSGQLFPQHQLPPSTLGFEERLPPLLPYLGDIGHEVVGDALGVFTNAARGVGARGVEIPQQHCIPGLRDTGQMMGVRVQAVSQLKVEALASDVPLCLFSVPEKEEGDRPSPGAVTLHSH